MDGSEERKKLDPVAAGNMMALPKEGLDILEFLTSNELLDPTINYWLGQDRYTQFKDVIDERIRVVKNLLTQGYTVMRDEDLRFRCRFVNNKTEQYVDLEPINTSMLELGLPNDLAYKSINKVLEKCREIEDWDKRLWGGRDLSFVLCEVLNIKSPFDQDLRMLLIGRINADRRYSGEFSDWEAIVSDLRALYIDEDMSANAIALQLNESTSKVQDAILYYQEKGLIPYKMQERKSDAERFNWEDIVPDLKRLYIDEGMTASEIAELLGTTENSVQGAITNYQNQGLIPNKREKGIVYGGDEKARILQLVSEGAKYREIAGLVNLEFRNGRTPKGLRNAIYNWDRESEQ